MPNWYQTFRRLINNSSGKICSYFLSEKHFSKINQLSLWEEFIRKTSHLSEYSYIQRVRILDAGHFDSIPLCYCNKPAKVTNRALHNFCSKSCADKDILRTKKMIASRQLNDQSHTNEKRKQTMIEKYGVAFNSQRPDIHHIWEKSKLLPEIHSKLKDKAWLDVEYNLNNRTAVDIAAELDCYYGTVIDYCKLYGFKIKKRSNYSIVEVRLSNWLSSLNIEHEMGCYSMIPPYEIDCYVKNFNLGIEINGLHWHSEKYKPKDYHLNKTINAENNGVELLHFYDVEWNQKEEIVKSIIAGKLGLSQQILASECLVVKLSDSKSREFLEKNHIQGFTYADLTIGLEHNNELAMVGLFKQIQHDDWELVRICSKLNVVVTKGLSTIIDYFRQNHNASVYATVDRRYGIGVDLEKAGFVLEKQLEPDYAWTDGNVLLSNNSILESENFQRIWDCGHKLLRLKI